MDKKRILFVDDEPRLLSGLQRMLHAMRKEWDMIFIEGGTNALAILEKQPVDVIVSDMRMPGMDGAELLDKVKEKYPQTVRIALSGQTSNEDILRSVGPIHQFLPKPCNADHLKATLKRVCTLQSLLINKEILGITSQLESLPCLPDLYQKLLIALDSRETSMKCISEIINQDVSMSTKILQMVNSAFFGISHTISNVSQAVTMLGIDTVRSLVLTAKVFSHFDEISMKNFPLQALWNHSITVANWAKLICKNETHDQQMIDYSSIAGMSHDIGQLIFASKLPETYEKIIQMKKSENISATQAEYEILGTSHSEVGAYLLGLWGFPDAIIDSVAYHHQPETHLDIDTNFSLITAVHVANELYHKLYSLDNIFKENYQIRTNYIEQLGLIDHMPQWEQICQQQLEPVG